MCDGETRTRDRTHTFVKLGEVQAKGYATPVPTFKPTITKHQKVRVGSSNANMIHGINRMETLSGTFVVHSSYCCASWMRENMRAPTLKYLIGRTQRLGVCYRVFSFRS
jgi:hypothetical protein